MMMVISDDDEYTRSAAAAGEERLSLTKKRKSKNKRRFSDEQIKSLETIFVSESKLEPRKKLQLATELGLQPRQVAIWFQNKRARFKSKQLERDYGLLRANYNGLASQFEALKKEKQYLQLQLQNLNEQVMKSREGNIVDSSGEVKSELGLKPSASAENSGHARTAGCGPEKEVKPGPSVESTECNVCAASSDEDSSMKVEYFGLDGEPEFMNVVDPAVSTLTSQESWRSLDSSGLIDQPGGSYQWWDFWS